MSGQQYLEEQSNASAPVTFGKQAVIVFFWLAVLAVLIMVFLVACGSGVASNVVNSL